MLEKIKENIIIVVVIAVLVVGGILYLLQPREEETQFTTLPYEDIKEEPSYLYIDIKGEVHNPGVYKIETNTRLYQLIFKAGGLTSLADEAAINLSMVLNDGSVIYIPSFDDLFPALGINLDIDDINDPNNPTQSSDLININTATKEQLITLPGIGESTANTILDYRTNNGVFETTENIKDVPGIGDATYENIKALITV